MCVCVYVYKIFFKRDGSRRSHLRDEMSFRLQDLSQACCRKVLPQIVGAIQAERPDCNSYLSIKATHSPWNKLRESGKDRAQRPVNKKTCLGKIFCCKYIHIGTG